jgi:hypothetical protein
MTGANGMEVFPANRYQTQSKQHNWETVGAIREPERPRSQRSSHHLCQEPDHILLDCRDFLLDFF